MAEPVDVERESYLDWNNADYDSMKVFIDLVDWSALFAGFPTVNDKWRCLCSIIDHIFDMFVPKKKRKKVGKRLKFPKEIRKLLSKKRLAYKKLRSFADPPAGLEEKCKLLNEKCSAAIISYYGEKEDCVLKQGTMKSFFNHVKNTLKTPQQAVSLNVDGEIEADDGKIAEAFSNQFESVFIDDNGALPALIDINCNNIPDDVCFSVGQISNVLHHLKSGSSPGMDGIPALFLKNLSVPLSVPLQVIFQQSFDQGVLPEDWLKAKIRPIYKNNGCRTNAVSYRPISLTSICCKVMERILKGFLLNHLSKNSIITPAQHGFLAKKSTETQLLECVNDWTGSLNRRENVDVFYMDISKAFDVVSHPKLLYKLKKYKIRGKFHNWITAFVQNRSQCVVVNGTLSTEQKVRSGVPQGSVLGPLLFLLYINDLPNVVKDSTVKIFADDTKLYLSQPKDISFESLHNDIERVLIWTAENQLSVAFHKSNILHLGSSNPQTEYIFDALPMPAPEFVRDLGVIIANDMKFSIHIYIYR